MRYIVEDASRGKPVDSSSPQFIQALYAKACATLGEKLKLLPKESESDR